MKQLCNGFILWSCAPLSYCAALFYGKEKKKERSSLFCHLLVFVEFLLPFILLLFLFIFSP